MLQVPQKKFTTTFANLKNFSIPIWFYALAAMFFWGMSFVWTSILLKYFEPITIIFIRLILSATFLFLVMFLTGKFQRIERQDYRMFFLGALFNPFLYFIFENYGLKHSSSTISSVIIATIPVFAPVVGYFALKERLKWFNLLGILLSFSGILVMLSGPDFSMSANINGVILLFGAVASALLYSVVLKRLSGEYTPLTIIAWQNLIGIVLFLPFFLFFEARQALEVSLNREIIYSFLLLSILASSLSFVFFVKTIQVLGVTKANIFSNLIPVFTAIFSFFILDEQFTFLKIAGIVVVIAGVYVSELSRNKR
jgi:drug/metabolite transporter (DMT)-like permease